MTRRMLDSAIFQNEKFGIMPPMARLLTIGIINQADDQGRGKAHPVYLRSQVFPYDDVTPEQVSSWLALVAQNETVTLYVADGKDYYQVVNWWKYQSHQYAMPSQFPKPPGWHDRIRKSLTKGVIVTCNWITTDGKQSPDTCDEQGLAIHLNNQVNDDLNIQVYVKDKVQVEDKEEVGDVASKGVVAPPIAAPPPKSKPKTPKPPAELPPPAIQALREIVGIYPPKETWDTLVNACRGKTKAELQAVYAEFRLRSQNKHNWSWVTEGVRSYSGKPNGKAAPNGLPSPEMLWGTVQAEIDRVHYSGKPELPAPILEAVEAVGGWYTVCKADPSGSIPSRLRDAYRSLIGQAP